MFKYLIIDGKTVSASIEPLKYVLPDLKVHFSAHYEEVSKHVGKYPLSPIYETYEALAAAGKVVCGVLREDGVVVGYYVGFIEPHLHYSTCLTCQTDLFYVAKHLRKHGAAKLLMDVVEEEIKRKDVKMWLLQAKKETPAEKLLFSMGAELTESTYIKWV